MSHKAERNIAVGIIANKLLEPINNGYRTTDGKKFVCHPEERGLYCTAWEKAWKKAYLHQFQLCRHNLRNVKNLYYVQREQVYVFAKKFPLY